MDERAGVTAQVSRCQGLPAHQLPGNVSSGNTASPNNPDSARTPGRAAECTCMTAPSSITQETLPTIMIKYKPAQALGNYLQLLNNSTGEGKDAGKGTEPLGEKLGFFFFVAFFFLSLSF